MIKNRHKQLLQNIRDSPNKKEQNERILLIDGTNTFIRVFAAVPALNENGDHVGGVIGFLKSIGSLIRKLRPTKCIIVFDGKGGSVKRRKIFPEYKNQRKHKLKLNRFSEFDTGEEETRSFQKQFIRTIKYLDVLPVRTIIIDNIEADDTIAYICRKFKLETESKNEILIVSTDKDFLQLSSKDVVVYNPVKKKIYTKETVQEEFDIHPNNFTIYRTVTGDPSDNIPGIKGVGIKTLNKLFNLREDVYTLEQFKEKIAELYENNNSKAVEKLANGINIIDRNYRLMQLQNPEIPAQYKERIINLVNSKVNKTNIFEFGKMFMHDKLYSNIKYSDKWLNETYRTLDKYAK